MMTIDGSSNVSSSRFNSSINNCHISGTFQIYCLSPWHIAASVIIGVICLLGIPANITVIVKLSWHLRGSSISQRLFFNLAVSDLLCLLCLPVGVFIFFNGMNLTQTACQVLFYFFFFCIISDLNILVLISIQRYYQVLHTKKWDKVGRNWQRFLLFSVWMLGALMALPVVFLLVEMENKDEPTSSLSCNNQRIQPLLEVFYISFIFFSYLVLLSFYRGLVIGVRRIFNSKSDKKKLRVTKLFIRIIFVSLVIGIFPVILRMLYVIALFTESEPLLSVSRVLTFAECCYFFNHCLNPFLYFFASRHHMSESNSKRKSFLMALNDNS